MPDDKARVVAREPCEKCGSRDNLARYDDGSAFCFSQGCGHYERPDGSVPTPRPRRAPDMSEFLEGDVRALSKRNIDEATAEKFDYRISSHKGEPVQVATFWRSGQPVFQKIRTHDKKFWTIGDIETCGLYGQHLWPNEGKRLVITEGEIDAMSVAQAFNLTWPVVSITGGAGNAVECIKRELLWLNGYDEVVLWFDNDEPGHAAAEACAGLFQPGKVKLAFAPKPHKDASDMLVAGEVKALCRMVYDAKSWMPQGIVSLRDIRERVLAPVTIGAPWPWQGVTDATYGRRDGEVYAFGAGTGVGKTDLFTQIIEHDVSKLGVKCGVLYLEQNVAETGKRIAGKKGGKRFHLPDGTWTQAELERCVDELDATNNLHLYDAFGATSWDVIGPAMRYLAAGVGCKHLFLDHLTALAAAEDDERVALERIMAEIASMAQELKVKVHFISHLATPEGKPHEEGGRVMIRHFKGSRSIGFWSHGMFGLERNQQADTEEEQATTTLRCLKDRASGNATGKTWALIYDRNTGLLNEGPPPAAASMPPVNLANRGSGDF